MTQHANKKVVGTLLILAALPLVYLTCALAQRGASRLRRVVPAGAKTITVRPGANLQRALDAAQPGDEIVLAAGATFTGNFVLPVKTGNAFITVRSSRCVEIPAERIAADREPLTAIVVTPNVGPVLFAPVRSHHFRFECLTFTQGLTVPVDPAVGFAWGYNLIQLGEGASYENQKTLADVPHHLEFDRVIVRTRGESTALQRGITLNSASTSITNSRISGIKWAATETQAIAGWNGPGPYLIENNYIEAAGINILFGGAPTAIPDLVPSDITIRRNTITKRLEWKGQGFAAKNLFELKNARRVTFTDNDCRYSWPEAQTGWAVILNAFRDGPQTVVDDVEIGRNVFRDVTNGINLRGMESDDTVTRMHRVNIHDNLIENMGAFEGEGKAFQVLNGTENVEINHNTVRGTVLTALVLQSLTTVKHAGLKFTNNLMPHGLYGIFGDGGYFGTAALNQYASGWTATGNALYAKPRDPVASLYPSGNFFPTTEKLASLRTGTDRLPVGVRAQAPTPMPTSAPTPTPTPRHVVRPVAD